MLHNMTLIHVPHEGGTLAVELTGIGPLVLCVPGMGETRASFRHLAAGLTARGFRVAAMDLRGHGDSSADFVQYDDEAAARDVLAIIEHLGGGPAVVIGNSMGAAAAVIAAATRPEAVDRLVLIGPFVRQHGGPVNQALMRTMFRVLIARPWGPAAWRAYYLSLFGTERPADHDAHVAQTTASLRRPGRWRAFQATTRTSHAPAEAALPRVSAPTLVIMGDRDRDFPDPEAEARWIADAVRGEVRMIAGAGHYPMGEQPEYVLAALEHFMEEGRTRG